MNNISKNLIYGLQDPFTHEIRYVGKSTTGLTRPKQHFSKYHLKRKQYVYSWIKYCFKNGKKPEIVIIQQFNNPDFLFEAEKYWIKYYKSIGCKLTNLTEGGEGSLGRKLSEETRNKISLSNMGKIAHNKGKSNLTNKGKKQSLELINKRMAKKRALKALKPQKIKKVITHKQIVDNNNNIYSSYCDASIKLFNSPNYRSAIRSICLGARKTINGYSFKYL
jgi:hypothetical protein